MSAEEINSLAKRVAQFAEGLSASEQECLLALLYAACDPLARLSLKEANVLFTEDELKLVEQASLETRRPRQ